jgi:hypothetical protein
MSVRATDVYLGPFVEARCFFAAFILSTRLGCLRPARFAAAFARALLLAVNCV